MYTHKKTTYMRKILILVMTASIAISQCTFKGNVAVESTGEPIPFANIVLRQNGASINGIQSSFDGYFEITNLKNEVYEVQVTCLGFQKNIFSIDFSKAEVINKTINMKAESTQLSVFEIKDNRKTVFKSDANVSVITMRSESMNKVPITMGENDIVNTLLVQPSITSSGTINNGKNPDLINKLTAGEIHDFSKYQLWQKYIQNEFQTEVSKSNLQTGNRYSIEVMNHENYVIPFAHIILSKNEKIIWQSITDNTGKAELWDIGNQASKDLTLTITIDEITTTIKNPKAWDKGINRIKISKKCVDKVIPIEISLVIDATSSMSDEIDYLKTDITSIIKNFKSEFENRIKFSSVFYKALENKNNITSIDFTDNEEEISTYFSIQKADGGGDEAVVLGLKESIHNLSWSNENTHKLLFIFLDEPQIMNDSVRISLMNVFMEASRKGIRIIPIICSGKEKLLEYKMRLAALLTNGTYLFLTDDSGIGDKHMTPTADAYEVYSMNELITKVIRRFTIIDHCKKEDNPTENISEKYLEYLVKDENVIDTTKNKVPLEMMIFPNPFQNITIVEINQHVIGELHIFDSNGKLIEIIDLKHQRTELDFRNYSIGTYFIMYQVANKKIIQKVVKT